MSGVAPPLIGSARIRTQLLPTVACDCNLKPTVQARVDRSHKPCKAAGLPIRPRRDLQTARALSPSRVFSSPAFFVFFAIYFTAHLIIPRAARVVLVIVGITLFYAWWNFEYVWLPFLLTAIVLLPRAVDREYEGASRSQTQACGSASSCCSLLSSSSNMSISFFYRDVVGPTPGQC